MEDTADSRTERRGIDDCRVSSEEVVGSGFREMDSVTAISSSGSMPAIGRQDVSLRLVEWMQDDDRSV